MIYKAHRETPTFEVHCVCQYSTDSKEITSEKAVSSASSSGPWSDLMEMERSVERRRRKMKKTENEEKENDRSTWP